MPYFEIPDGARAPSFQEMMLANILALKALDGEEHIYAIEAKVVALGLVNPDQQSYMMPNGKTTKLKYYLGWGRTYLRYAGALESIKRGTWALTDAGKQIDTLEHAQTAYERYTEQLEQNNNKKLEEERLANNDNEKLPPIDERNVCDDEEWKAARASLLEILKEIRPDAFEKLSYLLLCEAGFIDAEVVGKGADGGIDGWGTLQQELISFSIAFQCKRWQNKVGSPQIRNFRGAILGRVDKGLFFATSKFTEPAIKEAARDNIIAIDLIDGEMFCDLLKKYNLGVASQDGQIRIQNLAYFNNLQPPNPQQQGN